MGRPARHDRIDQVEKNTDSIASDLEHDALVLDDREVGMVLEQANT